MTTGDGLSIAILILSIVAMYVQIQRLRTCIKMRRLLLVICLMYFIAIHVMILTTTDVYLLRSGILSRIGTLFLLAAICFDKGDC